MLLLDWVPPAPLKGVAEEGTTFVWCPNGTLRVFEDGEEIPRVIIVYFNGVNAEDQTATVQHVLPNGSVLTRLLNRPFSSAFEKGRADA